MKIKFNHLIIVLVTIFLIPANVLGAGEAVKVLQPEIKDIIETETVNGTVEAYQVVRLSSKTGGIIADLEVELGQEVNKGDTLVAFDDEELRIQLKQAEAALDQARANYEKALKGASDEQIKSARASVEQAKASLEIAQANYDLMKKGATEEELAQVEASYEQAVASYEGAKKNLELLESVYQDRTAQKQQLINAETQLEATKKQLKAAEEGLKRSKVSLEQAQNGLQQAEQEYERMKYLYEEQVITKKQFELAESQLENASLTVKNARSAVENAKITLEQAKVSYQGALDSYQLAKENYDNPTQLEQQLDSAQTQLKVAIANKKIAKANLDKVKKGARTEELTTAKANVQQAKAALEIARANLEQVIKGASDEDLIISQANVEQAEAALTQIKIKIEDSVLKSPIKGIIAQINFEEGEMVGPGNPILVIVNLDQVYVRGDVNADLLKYIKEGDKVQVKVLAYPNKVYQGEVSTISPMADPQTKAFPVKVLLDNRDHSIKAGMFADLNFITRKSTETLVVPIRAVLDLDSNPRVFVVQNGRAEERFVEVGIIGEKEVEIVSGISKDYLVIYQGQHSLRDGDPVEVVK